MLSFIIVNYETADLCDNCINSIKNNSSLNESNQSFEIIIIDNNSSISDKVKLGNIQSKYSKLNIKIKYLDKNYGFGYANNRGSEIAKGEILCFLNSDIILLNTNISNLYKLALQKDSGFVSCYILNKDKSFQSAGFDFPSIKNDLKQSLLFSNFSFRKKKIKVEYKKNYVVKDWLSGAFLFVKKNIFTDINGFDEKIFMYSEDIDICFQTIKEGKKNLLLQSTYVIHDQKKAKYSKYLLKNIWNRKQNYFYVLRKNTDISNMKIIILKISWFLNTLAIVIYKKITSRRA
ncbi:MAG: glycosyltransferase [Enterococcus sp.]